MKKLQLKNISLALALTALISLVLGGCAAYSPQGTAQSAEPESTEPEWTVEPWDGYGLEIPLDGTSMDAWERSLFNVKAYTEPEDYQLLLSAIDYLLVYDLGARGSKDILISRLNGLTGYQIFSRVNYPLPERIKSRMEKAARDANPTDSG